MSVTIWASANSAGHGVSMRTVSYWPLPLTWAVTILSCSASYATNSVLTVMLGLASVNALIIALTSSSL